VRRSTIATTNSKPAPDFELRVAAGAAALISLISLLWVHAHGFTLYWGDAEAHLNIARRIVEARSTGYDQLGEPWLPLTHLLMLPLVTFDSLWQSGLAGAIPSALCFIAATVLFFAATRRVLGSTAAWCAMALFVLNPNALYLQSIPMMEAPFFACLMGVLFFTVRYRDSQTIFDIAGAALMCLAGTLTRYEGWIFLPPVTIYIFVSSKKARIPKTLLFAAVASLGVAWWLFYNWWLAGDALDFYRGPNSSTAIQAGRPYPGHGDWRVAMQYYFTAARLVVGWPLLWIGGIGILAVLWRRAVWPAVLLASWPAFFIWSMHSSAQPIHIPTLWPHSWYNTRYALAMLPLLAFGASAIRHKILPILIVLCAGFWLFHLDHTDWICWKESEQNSIARRAWTYTTALYLNYHARPTDTFFTTFGDVSGIFRQAGIHFKRTLTWDDNPEWQAAVNRPDLFLWEDWAIAQRGDAVDETIHRARALGVRYDLATEIIIKDALPIEIYHRHVDTLH
jgi:hypothetical protein